MEATNVKDSCNSDEAEAPEWLNAQFFCKVLKNHENTQDLQILNIKIAPASPKGDHYASCVFRSNVDYLTEKGKFSKSLIIKTMSTQEGQKKELLNNSNIFTTEIGMYSKALPRFQEILRKAGGETRLCVSCIYHSLEPQQVIILEDLVSQGYIVIRDREATTEEVQAALSKLAKWQAVSFYLLKKEPDYLKEFKYGIFDIPNLFDDTFMTSGMRLFLEFLDSEPELTKYKPYFKKMENEYIDRLRDIMLEYRENRQPNGYYVLCHGDIHQRNMMFKHNKSNGSLEDCMLLDFQSNNIVPISVDLLYTIYMMMGIKDRRYSYKELINFYFDVFTETLNKIGFDGELPNRLEFWNQLSRHKYYDIFLITTFLPMSCGFYKAICQDTAEILENENARKKIYYLPDYVEDVKYLLPRFEKLGFFE